MNIPIHFGLTTFTGPKDPFLGVFNLAMMRYAGVFEEGIQLSKNGAEDTFTLTVAGEKIVPRVEASDEIYNESRVRGFVEGMTDRNLLKQLQVTRDGVLVPLGEDE